MLEHRFCFAAVISLVIAAASSGCSIPTESDEDAGDVGDLSEALSNGCSRSREAILASTSNARQRAVRRGFEWLDARVPYSQRASRSGYRTDCSGFVSMCWELGQSYTTASFRSGGGESHLLGSYDALLPGDALVRRSDGGGHVVMFLGWNDASHSGACVLEQASTASDMQFRVRTTSSLRGSGYKAIRADKLRNDTSSAEPTEPTGEDDNGTDGVDQPETDGCWSGTLKDYVAPLTCVESASNGVWYQCNPADKKWYRGVSNGSGPLGACSSQHPLE